MSFLFSSSRLMRALDKKAPKSFSTSFWAQSWVSEITLDAHLDPEDDEGSRRPERIAGELEIIGKVFKEAGLKKGDLVLDLGCGPGLYAKELIKKGYRVAGWDISPAAIRWAKATLGSATVDVDGEVLKSAHFYRADFSRTHFPAAAAALLIYGTFSTLSEIERERTLVALSKALPSGAPFIFDCFSETYAREALNERDWYIAPKYGFWGRSSRIVFLDSTLRRKEKEGINTYWTLNRWGRLRDYHLRYRWFEEAELKTILDRHGFTIEEIRPGIDSKEDPELWMGVFARRK